MAICTSVIYFIGQYGEVSEVFPWLSVQAKQIIGHVLLYLCLGMLVARYLSDAFGLRSILLVLIVVDVCAVFGIYDEFHQGYVNSRGVEVFDVFVDMIGGFLGALIVIASEKLKRTAMPIYHEETTPKKNAIKQAVIALHVFIFVFIPAAVYSQDIAEFFTVLRSKLPNPVSLIAQSQKHGELRGGIKLPSTLRVAHTDQLGMKASDWMEAHTRTKEALNNFARVANLLTKKNEEKNERSRMPLSNSVFNEIQHDK